VTGGKAFADPRVVVQDDRRRDWPCPAIAGDASSDGDSRPGSSNSGRERRAGAPGAKRQGAASNRESTYEAD